MMYHVHSGELDVDLEAENEQEAARAALSRKYLQPGQKVGVFIQVESLGKEALYFATDLFIVIEGVRG